VVVEFGQSLNEWGPFPSMTGLKLVEQALLDAFWAGPLVKGIVVDLVADLDGRKGSKSDPYLWRQVIGVNLRRRRSLAYRDRSHDSLPAFCSCDHFNPSVTFVKMAVSHRSKTIGSWHEAIAKLSAPVIAGSFRWLSLDRACQWAELFSAALAVVCRCRKDRRSPREGGSPWNHLRILPR
jgi:hypothetical protein